MHLWDKRPKESPNAFAAKRAYIEMGGNRSLAKVGQSLGKEKHLLERWSVKWMWVAAAAAYDSHMAAVADDATAKRRAKIADDAERMRWELQGHEMEDATRLIEVAHKLLSLPHVRMKGKDGKTIAPASAQEFRAAAELIIKADDLRRKALDLPSLIIRGSLSGMSNEQLDMLGAMIFGDEGDNTGAEREGDSGEDGAQSGETDAANQ